MYVCVCVCVCVCIIIMIINKYILYIYLIHGKYCSATSGFLTFITTFVRQLSILYCTWFDT